MPKAKTHQYSVNSSVNSLSDVLQDPFYFVTNVLGVNKLTKEQESIIKSVWENKYTGVKSSPNMGKTFISACIVLAFLIPNKNSKVVTTAPTARQVEDLLWSEIASLYNNSKFYIGGKLNNTELILGDKWFATGISTTPRKEEESAVKMRGYHAPKILVVVDEATGVHPVILEAVEDITSSEYSRILMISNATTRSCGFYKYCKSPETNVIEMPCFTHPNISENMEVIPGAISTTWIKKQIQKHCEPVNEHSKADNTFDFEGRIYKPNAVGVWRLLARFPESATDTLIDYSKVENAMNRQQISGENITHIALDVARFGDDSSIFCINHNMSFMFREFYHYDAAKLAGEAIKIIKELKPQKFAVDCDGIGAGVYDIINEAKENSVFSHEFELIEIHSAASPIELEQQESFINLRAQMFWLLREDIELLSIEPNEELLDGLSSIKYFFTSKGKIQIEEKKDFKSRVGRSSDLEDALVYCNFLRYDESNEMKMFFINRE
jgi:phage terminase large subunit